MYHCAQPVHFSSQNIILSSKTSPVSIQDGNCYLAIWTLFTLKSIRQRIKRDFDYFKIIFFSFNASYSFVILACFFAHVDSLSAENMIPVLLSSAISI